MIGLPVAVAEKRLRANGYMVHKIGVSSRKGSGGTDDRVLKQSVPDSCDVVYLWVSAFVTQTETES